MPPTPPCGPSLGRDGVVRSFPIECVSPCLREARPAGGSTMQFKILGPLEVWADGASLDITAPRQRAVLAILLIEANRVVSLDHLIDRLYNGEPPRHAIGSVQAYVSHLRRLLEPNRPPRAPPRVLVSRPSGYTLV